MKARIDALEKFKRSQEAAALRDQLQDMDLPSSSDSETQEDSGAEESSDVPEMESSGEISVLCSVKMGIGR